MFRSKKETIKEIAEWLKEVIKDLLPVREGNNKYQPALQPVKNKRSLKKN